MLIYYILYALVFLLAYPLCIRKPSKTKRIIYIAIVFGMMFLMSIFRIDIGSDYNHYKIFFYWLVDGQGTMSTLLEQSVEPGYVLLMKLVSMISPHYFTLNLVTSAAILIPTAITIYRYSEKPWLSAWLYLAITFFYNSMNFTRQSLSVAIIFCGYRFFKEKKHIAVVLTIIAASLFHKSALVLLPVYFLSLIKLNVLWLVILSAAGTGVFIFSEQIIRLVTTYILPGYSKYVDTIFITTGLSSVYLIIPTIIMLLTLTAYFLGWKDESPENSMLASMSFYGFFIWLFVVKHFIIERFSLPVYVFSLISVPSVMEFYKNYFKCIAEGRKPTSNAGEHFKKEELRQMKLNSKSNKGRLIRSCSNLVMAGLIISTFSYNEYCMDHRVHGVFPYRSFLPAFNHDIAKKYDMTKDYAVAFSNLELNHFLNTVENGNYTVLITVKGNASGGMEFFHKSMLKKLGLQTDVDSLNGKSMIALLSGGKSVYEDVSDGEISQTFSLYNDSVYISCTSGENTSINVNRLEYAPNTNGLNIAVFDNDLRKLVTCQAYDTSDRELIYSYTSQMIF
ncbi:MAG: EpsG family protein [Huintestinicola sp.]